MSNQSILDQIAPRVVDAAKAVLGEKLDKVILYGSYARGDFDEESDIDILVLADIPREEAVHASFAVSDASGDLSLEFEKLVCLFVTDCKTFYEYIDVLPFYMNVVKDGIEWYVA